MTKRKRFYVGLLQGGADREVFSVAEPPTAESHSNTYRAVIGPFRTKAGAEYMARNPHCETVANAERAVLISRSQSELGAAFNKHLDDAIHTNATIKP